MLGEKKVEEKAGGPPTATTERTTVARRLQWVMQVLDQSKYHG